jgi:2-polyprenyl-3-methyl-5-hydroxy-6-metoxy-1,4-benzoquinol methylase
MSERVPGHLFQEDHYLGRPADVNDLIIHRRIALTRAVPGFCSPDASLLEIGCGNGATSVYLAPLMKQVTGVELFPEHQEAFEALLRQHKVTNCEMRLHDIESAPIQPPYDRLISFEVIEHLKHEESVANYAASLNPGALAVFSVPNKWWVFETHGAKLPLLPWNRVPFFSWLPRPLHERWANARIYTQSRIRKLLESHGFAVKEMTYITAPLDVLKDGALKRFLQRWVFRGHTTRIPFLSTSIFVVAVRKNP